MDFGTGLRRHHSYENRVLGIGYRDCWATDTQWKRIFNRTSPILARDFLFDTQFISTPSLFSEPRSLLSIRPMQQALRNRPSPRGPKLSIAN